MSQNYYSVITGTGSYIPNKNIRNEDFRKNEFYDRSGIKLDKENGIINLQMGDEVSRTRLIFLEDNQTLALHIGERWKNFNLILWFFYKRTVDSDFKNAKKVIENAN